MTETPPSFPPMQLIFNADHESELLDYIKAKHYFYALHDLKGKIRSMEKHGFKEDIKTPHDLLDYISTEFHAIIEEYNIDLNR